MMTLSNNQANELAGKEWSLNGTTYFFADRKPGEPGQTPWRQGTEGFAYPLVNSDGKELAYLKFFQPLSVTPKRVDRTKWLTQQQIHDWTDELRGAPRQWIDTKTDGRPKDTNFDFMCSMADAMPGQTWLELKFGLMYDEIMIDEELRERCVKDLLCGLAHLESRGVIHGDLSPNNIVIDTSASNGQPALAFIDFDGFNCGDAGDLACLSVNEGGTFGTDGYCPSDLQQLSQQDPEQAFPYSDRRSRDILLLEFFCYTNDLDADRPAPEWERREISARLGQSALAQHFPHLRSADIFDLPEDARPTSRDLAQKVGIRTPPRVRKPRIKRARPVRSSTLGQNYRNWFGNWEAMLGSVNSALWLLCIVHVALIGFWLSGRLFATDVERDRVQVGMQLGFRLLVGAAASLTAIGALSPFVFAQRQARLLNIGPFQLRLPPRRNLARSEMSHLTFVSASLLTLLAALVFTAKLLSSS